MTSRSNLRFLETDLDMDRQDGDRLHTPHVGDGITTMAGSWTFGGEVPAAFDSHVSRSVPSYAEGQELICDLADQLVPAGGRVYDLGCSTGTLTGQLAERLAPRRAELIGVDREPGMTARAEERCAHLSSVRFETASLQELALEPADMIISYYTLQFVPLRVRASIVERIHAALAPGGSFVLFEKVLASSARNQETAIGAYHDWKRRQGFGDEEIAAKSRSIRGVLQPQSPAENEAMLLGAGFGEIMYVFRWVLFEGLVARA
jgi:tRNA (cmo5U34)-methyltransferase